MKFFSYYSRWVALQCIQFYQKTLSFDHGPLKIFKPLGYCQFHPTCSEYAYQAIEKYGIFRGGVKAIWRLIRCQPFSRGGFDPVQ